MGARTFIQVTKKGDSFFVYVIPAPNPGMQQHEILLSTKTTNMFLKRKM